MISLQSPYSVGPTFSGEEKKTLKLLIPVCQVWMGSGGGGVAVDEIACNEIDG